MSGTEVVTYKAAPLPDAYDSACRALAEVARVEDGKKIADYAAAFATWARQANNAQALEDWTRITLRARRKCGELLIQMKEHGERRSAGSVKGSKHVGGKGKSHRGSSVFTDDKGTPTIAALGITTYQSEAYQKLAKMPEKKFEEKVAVATGKKAKPKAKPKAAPKSKAAPKPTTSQKKERLDEYAADENPTEIERKMFLHAAEDAAELADTTLSDLKKHSVNFSDAALKELDESVARVVAAWDKVSVYLKRGS